MKDRGWKLKENEPLTIGGYEVRIDRAARVVVKAVDGGEVVFRVLDRGGYVVERDSSTLTKPT